MSSDAVTVNREKNKIKQSEKKRSTHPNIIYTVGHSEQYNIEHGSNTST